MLLRASLVLCLLAACGPKALAIDVKEPTVVVVGWTSGHTLHREWRFAAPELRTADGVRIEPAHTDGYHIEYVRSWAYYVLPPGRYRLFNDRNPTIKTLRPATPRPLTGAVTSELDPRTDANDDRGRTSETWQIAPPDPRPYFLMISRLAPRLGNLRIRLLDDQGRLLVPRDRSGSLDGFPTESVASQWLGPLTGPSTLHAITEDAQPVRYRVRLVPSSDAPSETRAVGLRTVVTGALGPAHQRWDPEHGWAATIDVSTEDEQILYAVVWFAGDAEHVDWPELEALDERGRRVAMEHVPRKRDSSWDHTGVFATETPHRGTLRIAIRARARSSSSPSTGRYAVCVAADAAWCLAHAPLPQPVLRW